MRRAMQFRHIAMIDISANLIGSAVSVAMALTGWGYWSLVAKPIVTAVAYGCFCLDELPLGPRAARVSRRTSRNW